MAPNIIWIVFDAARADALEPYGAPAGSSPAVADLARRGHAVDGVHATACWTLPSHASMLAGGLPRQLGFGDVAGIRPESARPLVEALRPRLIPEVLRGAGYRTRGATANFWVSHYGGFDSGFDEFVDGFHRPRARMDGRSLRDRAGWLAQALRAHSDEGTAAVGELVDGWLEEQDDQPFFWFFNLIDCHSPYLPPKPYADLSAIGRLRAADEARRYLTMEAFWRSCITRTAPPAGALERMRAGYRGAIRYLDAWLERLLDGLQRAGILDDTLVIVTADHGENFGEGGLIGHGFSLDERLLHVPFVVAGPEAGTLRDIRSLAEVPRQLAEIAGVSGHPYQPDDLPPLAVAQLDPPAAPRGDARTEWAIEHWQLDEAAIARLVTPLTAVVDRDAKLLLRGEAEEFYDLAADPFERQPLQADQLDPSAVARLRGALAHPAVAANSTGGQGIGAGSSLADEERAELEDRMRLLGYL